MSHAVISAPVRVDAGGGRGFGFRLGRRSGTPIPVLRRLSSVIGAQIGFRGTSKPTRAPARNVTGVIGPLWARP